MTRRPGGKSAGRCRQVIGNFETISDAAQGLEILRMAGIGLNLFAQAADVNIDRTRGDKGSLLPDGIEQLIAREDTAAVGGEIFEQAEFANRGKNVAAADLYGHGGDIDLQIAEVEDLGSIRRLAQTAEHGADPRHQFARAERLGDVVVAAEFQAFDPVGLRGLRREKNDGNRRKAAGVCRMWRQSSKPSVPGNITSSRNSAGLLADGFGEHRSATREALDVESGGLQIVGDQARDVRFVFYHENEGARQRWLGEFRCALRRTSMARACLASGHPQRSQMFLNRGVWC